MTYKRFFSVAAVSGIVLSSFMIMGTDVAKAASNESESSAGKLIFSPSKFGNKGDGLFIFEGKGSSEESPKTPPTLDEVNKNIAGGGVL